jgi:hypothetical protein
MGTTHRLYVLTPLQAARVQFDLCGLGGPLLVAGTQILDGRLPFVRAVLHHQNEVVFQTQQAQALMFVPEGRVPAQQAGAAGSTAFVRLVKQGVPGRQEGIQQHWLPPGQGQPQQNGHQE